MGLFNFFPPNSRSIHEESCELTSRIQVDHEVKRQKILWQLWRARQYLVFFRGGQCFWSLMSWGFGAGDWGQARDQNKTMIVQWNNEISIGSILCIHCFVWESLAMYDSCIYSWAPSQWRKRRNQLLAVPLQHCTFGISLQFESCPWQWRSCSRFWL